MTFAPLLPLAGPLVVCITGMILAAAALAVILWRFCR